MGIFSTQDGTRGAIGDIPAARRRRACLLGTSALVAAVASIGITTGPAQALIVLNGGTFSHVLLGDGTLVDSVGPYQNTGAGAATLTLRRPAAEAF